MSVLLKKMDEMAEMEDEEVTGVFDRLYGPVLQLSLLFPSWKRENLHITFGLIGFYSVSVGMHFYIASISVMKLTDDFENACLVFHYWLIYAIVFAAVFLLNYDREALASIHKNLAQELGEYKSGRIYSEEKPMRLENNKKKELIQFLVLPGLMVVIATVVFVVPFITKFNNPPNFNSRGVNMNLPMATYYPMPTERGFIFWLVVMGQLLSALSVAVIVVAMEILNFRMTQAIIFEYKVLQYAFETLFTRAERHFLETHPEHRGRLSCKNVGYQKCIGEGIKDCVKHHHKILKVLSSYKRVLNWPAAMVFGIGTGMIGVGLFNFLKAKEKGDYELMVTFGLLVLAETLNMYIISGFGENITTEGAATRMELYFIEWRKLDIANRRLMLNFQVGITNPVIVKAGGYVAICMATFSSIMNTSYSFLNIMNAN